MTILLRAASFAITISAKYVQTYRGRTPSICTLNLTDNLPPWQSAPLGSGQTYQGDYLAALLDTWRVDPAMISQTPGNLMIHLV